MVDLVFNGSQLSIFSQNLIWKGMAAGKIVAPVSPTSVIVLNSLTNLSKVLPVLQEYDKVSAFLDTDETGLKAFGEIKSASANVADFSKIYKGFKDFNEMLCSQAKRQP